MKYLSPSNSDNIDHVSLEMCLELLGLAKQFDLELLRALCERILEQSITVENVGKFCYKFCLTQRLDIYWKRHLQGIQTS